MNDLPRSFCRAVHRLSTGSLRPALFVVGLAVALSLPAHGGERRAKPETKKVQALGEWAYKRLNNAHEHLAAEKYGAALAVLDEMKGNSRLNKHEQALMWQTYGYAYSGQEKYAPAAESFEKCLATGGLPEVAEVNTRYNLAQLYLAVARYDEAIKNLLVWFDQAENPDPSVHFILAMAYVQNKEPEKALPHAEQAVQKASEPHENWLQLLAALYLEEKNYTGAVGVLKQLADRFPKKTYFLQLSAVYSELKQKKKALAAIELAYVQGLLTKDSEYMTLAQLYLMNDIPYEAAQVLDGGLSSGAIEGDREAWSLLADSWLQARDRGRALDPLERAAKMSDDGDLYLRLAQVQLEEENWKGARNALTAALRKGKLKDPGNAQLLLGVANAGEKNWEEARRAFQAAQKHEKTKDAATKWLDSLATQVASRDDAEPALDEAAETQ